MERAGRADRAAWRSGWSRARTACCCTTTSAVDRSAHGRPVRAAEVAAAGTGGQGDLLGVQGRAGGGPPARGAAGDLGSAIVRVHVVSDVHGSADALARAGDGADALVCLGDLSLSSTTPTTRAACSASCSAPTQWAGSWRCAPPAATTRPVTSPGRCGQRFDDRQAAVDRGGARSSTRRCSRAFPDPTYVTYGNVDVPTVWAEFARPGVRGARRRGGRAGGLAVRVRRRRPAARRCGRRSRWRRSRTAAEIAARRPLGEVDVLLQPHPAGGARAPLRHRRPPVRDGQRRRCSRRSGPPSRGTPCSGTSTSRCAAAADRSHRVRQRRPLPAATPSSCAGDRR